MDTAPDVTVCLRNSIVATPGSVERAKMLARNMFASAGFKIVWRSPGSDTPPGIVVDVTLDSGETAEEDSSALAEAFPFAGSTGHITINYSRVRTSAGISRELEPLLLAHVLVHEITHVLQCLDRHADTGVMKAHWSSEDYYEMRWKPLPFTPEDIELLRLGMRVLRARPGNQIASSVNLTHGQ
jgi:hypothetical protein